MSQIFRTFHRFLTELSETIPELKPAIDVHLSKSSLPKEDDELLGKFLKVLRSMMKNWHLVMMRCFKNVYY
jgi:hypothetical protein